MTRKNWADGVSYDAFTYDGVGNQLSHRQPDASLHSFTYDGMDRLDTASYAGEFVYHFDYTLTGMRDLITEQRNSVTTWTSDYAYDAQDRVTSVTTPNGTVSYTYDPNGNRASMTTPSGTTSYQYNGNDQLTQVTAPMGQTNLTYTNVGLPDTLTYPNGVVKDYGYDDRDRLTSLTYQDGMTTLAAYNYTLDTVGNRTRVDELGGDYTTWGYDNQYRLTNETIHDGGSTLSSSYTYDAVGNRTSQTVNGQATTYSYNALDQMTQSVTGGTTTTYAYDGRGNLATTTTGSDVTTYTYDALDRLITAQVPGSSAAAYTYDPNGQRVRQTVGSDTTNYLWDELSAYGDVVRETNGTGTELASYTLAGSQILGQTRSGVTSYYLSDGQGSTRALLNGTGDLTDTYAYTAFGEMYNQTGSTLNSYLYTGQQFDSLTGLYSLRARYYDPNAGRFVSRDTYPINYRNPIELNRYGYVGNNPVNKYDPSGLSSLTELAVELFRFNEERAGISGVTGFTTGLLTSFVIYFGAASGMCGEEAKEWSKHVDPGKLVFNAAVGGFETGFIWGFAPPIITIGVAGYSIAVSAGSEGSGSQAPQSSFAPTISDSFCFLSQTAKYITDKMFELNEGKKPDTYKIAGFGAVAMAADVAGPVVTQFPLGLSATETGAFISAGYTLAVGVVSGIIASMAAVTSAIDDKITLYHYTKADIVPEIVRSGVIWASDKDKGDATYGNGQYFTDLTPTEASTLTKEEHSLTLYNNPDHWGSSTVGWMSFEIPREKVGNPVHSLYDPNPYNRWIYRYAQNGTPPDSLPINDIMTGAGIVNFRPELPNLR
ncbi:MAG: hypothetical protein K8L91_21110 [Anaerolineae bacterium]|nr:hypothetical protein [Anaerolineae bacterium]